MPATRRRRLRTVLALVLALGAIALSLPTHTAGADPVERALPNSRFIELRGVRTHVQVWEPSGPVVATVVGLHHFYGSSQTFTAFGEAMAARGVRVAAFDRVGFGLTDRPDPGSRWTGPDAPYTRAFAAEQVRELLDVLEVERAAIVGVSMGGTTAIQFALAHPDRVLHLFPVAAALTGDSSPPERVRPLLRSRLVRGVATAVIRRGAAEVGRDRVLGSWLDPSTATSADVEANLAFRGVTDWDRGLLFKFASDERPDLPPLLPRLKEHGVPVTAVGGSADRIILPKWVRLVAELTGGEAVILPCGHVVQQECPDALAEVVLGAIGG